MTAPRTIVLKASDVGQILGQVLDGQNAVLEKLAGVETQNTELAKANALLERRVSSAEERLAGLMEAVAERRRMFRAIAKESFLGLLKITGIVVILALMGYSFRDALMKAIH